MSRNEIYHCDRCGADCTRGNDSLPHGLVIMQTCRPGLAPDISADLCETCELGLKYWWKSDWKALTKHYALKLERPAS